MKNKELTPNEIRGVDLVVKALTKKYKFIVGWEPDKKYKQYENTLFIHLKINYDMVSDYFGMRITPSIKKHIKDEDPQWWGRNLYSLTAFLDEPEGYDGGYQTKKQMSEQSKDLYKELPPQLQRTYVFNSFRGDQDVPVTLNIHGFILY
jgi:hypothetical protein